jgi:hypothetical protein
MAPTLPSAAIVNEYVASDFTYPSGALVSLSVYVVPDDESYDRPSTVNSPALTFMSHSLTADAVHDELPSLSVTVHDLARSPESVTFHSEPSSNVPVAASTFDHDTDVLALVIVLFVTVWEEMAPTRPSASIVNEYVAFDFTYPSGAVVSVSVYVVPDDESYDRPSTVNSPAASFLSHSSPADEPSTGSDAVHEYDGPSLSTTLHDRAESPEPVDTFHSEPFSNAPGDAASTFDHDTDVLALGRFEFDRAVYVTPSFVVAITGLSVLPVFVVDT